MSRKKTTSVKAADVESEADIYHQKSDQEQENMASCSLALSPSLLFDLTISGLSIRLCTIEPPVVRTIFELTLPNPHVDFWNSISES